MQISFRENELRKILYYEWNMFNDKKYFPNIIKN